MLENTIQEGLPKAASHSFERRFPRYFNLTELAGIGLTALGVGMLAYGYAAAPFSYDSQGIVDDSFVRGMGAIFGAAGLGVMSIGGAPPSSR